MFYESNEGNKDLVQSLLNAISSVFEIKKILKNGFELYNIINEKTYTVLSLTKMTIPVSPGRNVAVVIETAASVYRLSQMGYNAMDDLTERMKNQ